MFRSRKTQARPADDSDARIRMIDLEAAQRRDPYAFGRGDRPRGRRPRPLPARRPGGR